MLRRLQEARVIWPTLAALGALAVLIGLGSWQLERKAWKEGLLAKIAARVSAEPVPLAQAIELQDSGRDVEYLHVSAAGRFLHDKERYVYSPMPSGLGWHVYTPFEFGPGRYVWVNRGAVPDARKDPATRPAGQIPGETRVRGLVRQQREETLFTPDNNPGGNLWYWADIPGLTASAFPDTSAVAVLPFTIDADAQPLPPGGLPKGGVTRIALPNRHLEYAITWFGIALTLVGVYLAFAANRLQSPKAD